MKWYLAKLIFSIDVSESTVKAEFDEQFRLIQARTEEEAYYKAKSLGKKLQSTFFNANNKLVSWRFIDASELNVINELSDGVEIYSNTIETNQKESFINSVLQKAMGIQAKNLTFY